MDPQSSQSNNFEAPANRPPGDMIPLLQGSPEAGPGMPETAINPSQPPAAQAQSMPMQPGAAPSVPSFMSATPTAAPVSLHPAAPAVANDLDLIEKEWVEKAKSIVAQTKHDPYSQNKEINTFKADYMKKRYNKDIKIEL